ncbi:unnamed protein product [Clonostachys rosea]|uniref:C2H2-type domain-containing protein n=1 Tax=Bionectria ochroleuca TaxID=29856 RepID=A0ABY6UVX3_BIOOC|nr:unnamed protein product [Clonostachys rosea]
MDLGLETLLSQRRQTLMMRLYFHTFQEAATDAMMKMAMGRRVNIQILAQNSHISVVQIISLAHSTRTTTRIGIGELARRGDLPNSFAFCKEHIRRKHKLKEFQCERCLRQFTSENEYKLHIDNISKCEILKHGKIGQATYGVLSSRSLYKGMNPESRWIVTYCLLFLTEGTVPSPYFDDRSNYELTWSDGHILDRIRRKFPRKTESTIHRLYSVPQCLQPENSMLDKYICRTGESAFGDLHGSSPPQPLDNIAKPGILDRDDFESSNPNPDVLSWEETSSDKDFHCGQGELISGKQPNSTTERPKDIGISWLPPSVNNFSDVEMSETLGVHLSPLDESMSSVASPSMRSSDYEFSEQHQNLNHEFSMHHLTTAEQDE